jgi:hypothetical protein
MGLFDFLKKKDAAPKSEEDKILEGAEDSTVLVPNHAKVDLKKADEEVFLQKNKSSNIFHIFGLYDTGALLMLSGVVESGKLKKKMKVKVNGKELVIADLKIGANSVEELLVGEEGSIFVKSKGTPLVKYGDVLEFK